MCGGPGAKNSDLVNTVKNRQAQIATVLIDYSHSTIIVYSLLKGLLKGVTSGVIVGGTADTRSYVSAQLPGFPIPAAMHSRPPHSHYLFFARRSWAL